MYSVFKDKLHNDTSESDVNIDIRINNDSEKF